MKSDTWRGVNLGGWLVIEKWMTPSLFAGTKALDEYTLCIELGKKAAPRLNKHRKSFITETDFAWLAQHGVNAIRLPVGHWILDDEDPYISGIEFVDKAMRWAERYEIDVVLDLHGAPGSQNGKDHSGRIGKAEWHHDDNRTRSLDVIEELAKRYGKSTKLVGIELLNEPSWQLGKRRLNRYYQQAYVRIRKHCDKQVAVVFPDAFKPKRWRRTLRGKKYSNVIIDVHHYQLFNWFDRRRGSVSHMKKAFRFRKLLTNLQRTRPVIVGEWSAALPAKAYEGIGHADLQRAYAAAQIAAMDNAKGWFYWSYKTEGGGPWSFRECVVRGILSLDEK